MIALVDDLPLVEFSSGTICAFRPDWLRCHLLAAASRAGYDNWWLADHVTQSVTWYLASQFTSPVLAVGRLVETVQSVLQAIGYAEVGDCFEAVRPTGDHSLLQLARASEGCELIFFEDLRLRIQTELRDGTASVNLSDVTGCCKFLKGAKHFTRECASLRDEIRDFAAAYAHQASGGRRVSILIR